VSPPSFVHESSIALPKTKLVAKDAAPPQEAQPTVSRQHSIPRQLAVFFISVVALGVVAWFDVVTGPNIHVGFLYWFPVALAAWFGGRLSSYLLVAVAATLWRLNSEPQSDFEAAAYVPLVNLIVHIIYYPIIVEVVLRSRNAERRLETQVRQRTVELSAEVIERKNAQDALRKLAAQLSEAEDGERRRVAYDIHDALSQMLGVVKLNLETAVAESPIDTRHHERLVDLVKITDSLIHQTRNMTFDLHPSMLEDLGLVSTLKQFADEFHRRTMAAVIVNEVGERKKIPNSLASYLFRATKELVNNSVKHGNASEIVLTVHWTETGIRIVVDDDGSGFDTVAALAPQARRGLGLPGINERLTSLGGTLRLESQPGQGARIILESPLPLQ
jgi:signal transduction histidine kinase